MTAKTRFEVVFTATDLWWQLRNKDFELADDYVREALEQVFQGEDAYLADSDEAFACTILSVDARHTAIKAGDIVVSDGIGSNKIFLRNLNHVDQR